MSKTSLATFALAAISIFPISMRAQNAPADAFSMRTPEQVVAHHFNAFTHHDVEAVMSDYADDAIFIAPKQTVQGKAALRKMFESFPTNKAPIFEAKITADGDVGYEHWVMNPGKPDSVSGTDAFVVRHGKILFHTVVTVEPASSKQ